MATSGWRAHGTLKAFVFEHYGRFNVFQLMRLLLWKRAPGDAQSAGIGRLAKWPAGRRLRFRADLSAAFPGREISHLSARADRMPENTSSGRTLARRSDAIDLSTPNFCIASALGPLPEPFTEWVRDLQHARQPAMAGFLDLFNQRLNQLRFELKSQQLLGLSNLMPEETAHAHYLSSIMGLGSNELAAQVPVPHRAWLGIAGLMSNSRRSASTITHVLSLYLGARVTLESMVGAWHDIEASDRTALGRRAHRLGQQTVLGGRVWDQQARVRLTVAPLPYERFCVLLPEWPDGFDRGASAEQSPYAGFIALLRLLLDRMCDCEVRLQVLPDTIPVPMLEAGTAARRGLRLGQTAWLAARDNQRTDRAAYAAGYLVRAFEQRRTA